jgi:SlyX protein
MKQHIEELESQLAFQEHTVQTLNEIVTRQQRDIEKLQQDMQAIISQIRQLNDAVRRPAGEEAPPPHY